MGKWLELSKPRELPSLHSTEQTGRAITETLPKRRLHCHLHGAQRSVDLYLLKPPPLEANEMEILAQSFSGIKNRIQGAGVFSLLPRKAAGVALP